MKKMIADESSNQVAEILQNSDYEILDKEIYQIFKSCNNFFWAGYFDFNLFLLLLYYFLSTNI